MPRPLLTPSNESARTTGDLWLFAAVLSLTVIGLMMVYSSSAAISIDRYGSPHEHGLRHAWHMLLAGFVLAGLWRLDYRRLDSSSIVHGLWLLLTALLVITLMQPEIGGAHRWIRLAGFSLQPSEFAKVGVVLVAAFQLSRRQDRLDDPYKGILPVFLLVAQLAVLTALQPDFGTAAMLLGLLGVLSFVAGTPFRTMARFGAIAFAVLAVYMVQQPYRLLRLRVFFDPSFEPLGAGFQLRQSLIAIGTGGVTGRSADGLFGTGLGCSLQKLFFLPEPHTDFVFSVLAEELGLVGTLTVVMLFGVVLIRGLVISARASDMFGTLLAAGATTIIGGQALINMMVVTGLFPTKGIPLPFLSAGGSSLLVSAAAAGLLLSVSRHVC